MIYKVGEEEKSNNDSRFDVWDLINANNSQSY